MKVRAAVPDDAAVISSIHIRSWQAAYVDILDAAFLDGLTATHERRTNYWRNLIDEPRSRSVTLVAENDAGDVVGFAHSGEPEDAETDPIDAELSTIYLYPEEFGKGYGTALWQESATRLRELGFASAFLWVFEANESGRSFYEARGWTADGGYASECLGLDAAAVRYRINL